MIGLKIRSKPPIYLGFILIAVGLLFKRLVELTLVPDARIESSTYLGLLLGFQLLVIASGTFLIIKQPAIRLPRKTDLLLLIFSISITYGLLEVGTRLWLRYLATPAQFDRFVLFTSIKPEDLTFIPHPYLGYYPTPNYKKGGTFHNSLGYRNTEWGVPDRSFRWFLDLRRPDRRQC